MTSEVLSKMIELSGEQHVLDNTVEYLSSHLKPLVKPGEKVIICFPDQQKDSLSDLYARAVQRAGGSPVLWGPDRRWKSLLQQCFFSRASVIVGPPLVILGLAKLKKQSGLPLYIRHAITAGYPCMDWIVDGIQQGLDCTAWGSFGIGTTSVVAGFSCDHGVCIHLRSDVYGLDIVDEQGNPLPQGSLGEMVLYPHSDPKLRYPLGEVGRLESMECRCGCKELRVVDFFPGRNEDMELVNLGQELHSWTSVLDCRIRRGEYGLEIELVVFPGEKLPKLPTAAKQVIRPWDPKHDEPFFYKPRFGV